MALRSIVFLHLIFACRVFPNPLPSAIVQRIRGLSSAVDVEDIDVGGFDRVDDEIEEKHGIAGDNGDKVEEGMANDEIGEIHDDVGERGQEVEVEVDVYVGVAIEVEVVESRTFSVKEHILLMLPCASEIA